MASKRHTIRLRGLCRSSRNPEKHRLDARFELCEFLLARGLKTDAYEDENLTQLEPLDESELVNRLEETVHFWQDWAGRCIYEGN